MLAHIHRSVCIVGQAARGRARRFGERVGWSGRFPLGQGGEWKEYSYREGREAVINAAE